MTDLARRLSPLGSGWRTSTMVCVAATALGAAAPALCAAQGTGAALTHVGTFAVGGDQTYGAVMPATQRRAVLSAADNIIAILQRDKALAHPVGYNVSGHRLGGLSVLGQDDPRPASQPPHFGFIGKITYFDLDDDGHGGTVIAPVGGSVDFSVVANGIGRSTDLSLLSTPLDGGPPILSRYRVTGEFRGRPMYNGECTYVSSRPVPPLLPVTKERYLHLMILNMRADSARNAARYRHDGGTPMADAHAQWLRDRPKREADAQAAYEMMRKIDPASAAKFLEQTKKQEADLEAQTTGAGSMDTRIQDIERSAMDTVGAQLRKREAQLQALSAAERQQPVAVAVHGVEWSWGTDELLDFNDPDADPLVEINPAFYDRSAAPGVPQLIWICLPGLQGNVDKDYERYAGDRRDDEQRKAERRVHDAVLIRDNLDWAALDALVRR
jgi:hypothetical protein